MKYILIILSTFFLFVSCERGLFIPPGDCSYCYHPEPEEGDLIIDLTINHQNDSVIVTTYFGKLEDNYIMYIDTVTEEEFEVFVPVNNYYTVTAEYNVNGKKIIAVDGDEINTRKDYDCDVVCYRVVGGYFDLRLKYDK